MIKIFCKTTDCAGTQALTLSPTLNVFWNVGDNSITCIVCKNNDENLFGNSRLVPILIPYRQACRLPVLLKKKKPLHKKDCFKKGKERAIAEAIALQA